ncbi:MAG: precorrin-6y C5,15-methyltransferase (decarboxylating) subunit CbiE [Nitrospirae bacterium]|nr:precorrin-6y C5,15-methyltransferase (decarboxylating) subunit CbiE [Nitrospirota bacterium]
MAFPVAVIGVPPGDRRALSADQVARILGAGLLIASARHLDEFPEFSGDTLTITNNVTEVATACERHGAGRAVVVLGSGDPNLFGIGHYLLGRLGPARVRVEPAASSMQLAFAKAGLAWHDAVFGSCHGKPVADVVDMARRHAKVGLFTDPANTPQVIARHLLDAGLPDLTAHVCGNLGLADESHTSGRLSEVATWPAAPALNVMILVHDTPPARPLAIGLPEEAFAHRKPKVGLITRREVRAVALSKLRLTECSVVWDIGAGSGSVAVECALAAHRGRVFAIEKNAEDVDNVRENIARFHVPNLTAVHATAPDGLDDLPDPDAVFIGGSGKRMTDLLDVCLRRLPPGGALVLTLATLENLATAYGHLKGLNLAVEVTQMQVSRGVPILDMVRLEAQNPITILAVRAGETGAPGT